MLKVRVRGTKDIIMHETHMKNFDHVHTSFNPRPFLHQRGMRFLAIERVVSEAEHTTLKLFIREDLCDYHNKAFACADLCVDSPGSSQSDGMGCITGQPTRLNCMMMTIMHSYHYLPFNTSLPLPRSLSCSTTPLHNGSSGIWTRVGHLCGTCIHNIDTIV